MNLFSSENSFLLPAPGVRDLEDMKPDTVEPFSSIDDIINKPLDILGVYRSLMYVNGYIQIYRLNAESINGYPIMPGDNCSEEGYVMWSGCVYSAVYEFVM